MATTFTSCSDSNTTPTSRLLFVSLGEPSPLKKQKMIIVEDGAIAASGVVEDEDEGDALLARPVGAVMRSVDEVVSNNDDDDDGNVMIVCKSCKDFGG